MNGGHPKYGNVHPKKGSKCAKMKTDVKFENISDSYEKFRPEVEKNDETVLRPSKMRLVPFKRGSKMCRKKKPDV